MFGSLNCVTRNQLYVYRIEPTEAQICHSVMVDAERASEILTLWQQDELFNDPNILEVVKHFAKGDDEWCGFFKDWTLRRIATIFSHYLKVNRELAANKGANDSLGIYADDIVWIYISFPIILEAWENPLRTGIEGRVRLMSVRKVGENANMENL